MPTRCRCWRAPINVHALSALAKSRARSWTCVAPPGSPPPTTLRGHLRTLTEIGVVERRAADHPHTTSSSCWPSPATNCSGWRETLQAWLAARARGPLTLGGASARAR